MRLRKKVIFIQQTCPQLIPLLSPLGKVEISNYILKICEIYKLIRESDKNDYRDLIALDVIKIESESRCNIVKLVQLFNPNGLTEYNFDYSNLKLHFYSLAASFNNIWQRAQLLRFYFETEEKPLEIYNIVAINLFLLTRGSDAAAPYLLETEEI